MSGNMPVSDDYYGALMSTFGEPPTVPPAVTDDWRIGAVAELRLTEVPVGPESPESPEDSDGSLLVEVRTTPDGDWVELPFPADGEIHKLGDTRLRVVVSDPHNACEVYRYTNGSSIASRSWRLSAGDPPITV